MSVYIVIEAKVKDQEKYRQYISAFSDIIGNYGGRHVVDEGRVTLLDDGMRPERRQPERMIILEFPSEVNLRRCFASPEYQTIASLRLAGADTRAVLLQGYKPDK